MKINLNKTKLNSYELNAQNSDKSNLSFVDITFFVYPLDTNFSAKDIQIQPYDEYIENLSKSNNTSYEKISDSSKNIFGIFLSLIIFLIFLIFKPEILISVESIVSIFASYTIGKELWNDIDEFLQDKTKNWRIKWIEREFSYKHDELGTINNFIDQARTFKYKTRTILADKFDFQHHSNAKILKLGFNKKIFSKEKMRLLNFRLSNNSDTFIAGMKLTLKKKFLFINYSKEIFQILHKPKDLKLDTDEIHKTVLNIGNLKIYLRENVL